LNTTAPDSDQSTGTNRAGVKPGQVPALPAASSGHPGRENGGGEHIKHSSRETHIVIIRSGLNPTHRFHSDLLGRFLYKIALLRLHVKKRNGKQSQDAGTPGRKKRSVCGYEKHTGGTDP